MDCEAAAKTPDALTQVVIEHLTELAALEVTVPAGSDRHFDFADRVAAILAQVAANLNGGHEVPACHSGSWESDLVRQIMQGVTCVDELDASSARPIYVPIIDGEELLAEHLAAYDQVISALDDAYSKGWDEALEGSEDPTVLAWRTQNPLGVFEINLGDDDDPRGEKLQAWNTQRLVIEPIIDADPAVAALWARSQAAEQARTQVITEYEMSFLAAMTKRARALGHAADLVVSDDTTDIVDWDLINDLQDAARATTPKPDLMVPAL